MGSYSLDPLTGALSTRISSRSCWQEIWKVCSAFRKGSSLWQSHFTGIFFLQTVCVCGLRYSAMRLCETIYWRANIPFLPPASRGRWSKWCLPGWPFYQWFLNNLESFAILAPHFAINFLSSLKSSNRTPCASLYLKPRSKQSHLSITFANRIRMEWFSFLVCRKLWTGKAPSVVSLKAC